MEYSPLSEDEGFFEDDEDFEREDGLLDHLDKKVIHVRKQKRRGSKWLTTIENLPAEHSKEILRTLKRQLCCNGSLIPGEAASSDVIQLQGDHIGSVSAILDAYLPDCKTSFHG